MFVVSLTYKVPQDIVDYHRAAHMAWVKEAFDAGIFLASGRRVPAVGGVLLSSVDRATLDASLARDPFFSNGVAESKSSNSKPPAWQKASRTCWKPR